MPLFSLIVPTRGRPEGLRRLLDSLLATAANPESIELIAVVDEDDVQSRDFQYSALVFHTVVVPPGLSMGELNLAGYRTALGRYLMLLNDDVIARTAGWDAILKSVLEHYPDGIVLGHVNDLLFSQKLCTFPLLTRDFCDLSGGIGRPEYRRYRIDDHIHNIFDLLHTLGHTRRIYLPDVVFEHCNTVEGAEGVHTYAPDNAIQEEDTRAFEQLATERRRVALACVERIEGPAAEQKRAERLALLEACADPVALRRPEHARVVRSGGGQARAAELSIDNWPDTERPLPWLSRAVAAAGNLLARAPQSAQIGFRFWQVLAEAAARYPFLSSSHLGIPPALFDAEWYSAAYPGAAAGASGSLLHYLREGAALGYRPNPHFDTRWYLTRYPDVAASRLNPLLHFFRYGAAEGRNPNMWFDVRYYELQNPNAAGSLNPLEHFLLTPPDKRRSPNPSLTLEQYYTRLEWKSSPARVAVDRASPLSVVIPTRNRVEKLAPMLDACRRYAGGCELEFVIIDDGSTDSTPEFLREIGAAHRDVTWRSLPPGGPGRARNAAAALARHDVLLFLGDDIFPAGDDFFRVHARRHAEHPEPNFAVLGRIDWPREADFPVTYTMARILEDGAQFGFSRLVPREFAGWQFFYTSNVSVKKDLVGDWEANGFDTGFPGAALEDAEFAYRQWHSDKGLRLYHDPESVGLHRHPYTLGAFLDRQRFVGQSLPRLIELHPELLPEFGLGPITSALHRPHRSEDPAVLRSAVASLGRVESFALQLEAEGSLGSEPWHADLLSALFEARMHDGYVSTLDASRNHAAARSSVVERFFRRVPQLRRLGA
jgi:glycosyltransferase involved in cell wall biosynthesis